MAADLLRRAGLEKSKDHYLWPFPIKSSTVQAVFFYFFTCSQLMKNDYFLRSKFNKVQPSIDVFIAVSTLKKQNVIRKDEYIRKCGIYQHCELLRPGCSQSFTRNLTLTLQTHFARKKY